MSGASADFGPRAGVLAPLPSCERGVAAVTACSPDGALLVYCNGSNVVVRDLSRPALTYVYPEHAHAVKCAKFSPSGKYVASGDASGKVRVWAWTQAEHSLKFECPCGQDVEDLSWDVESKRILAVGGGQTKANVFQFDTGSRLGEIVPHNKKAVSGDLRPVRPFRMVTGSEDMSMQLYQGPPFKYVKSIKEHSNFVNCVRFSPDGARLASVSSDKSGVIYHGETGDVLGKLAAEGGHAGGVLHCSWSPDSKRLVTSGGDKAVKVWDMAAAGAEGGGPPYPCVASWVAGTRPEDMQNSVCWAGASTIVSTSLDGTLNVFNAADVAAGPVSRIEGHQQPANCLEVDRASGNVYTACAGGRLCVWRPLDEARTLYEAKVARGEVATKKAAAVCLSGGCVAIAAWDDKLRIGDAVTGELQRSVALGAQPKGVAACGLVPGVFVVATGQAVLCVRAADGKVLCTVPCAWAPTCVDAAEGALVVCVGGGDKRVHVFALGADGASLAEQGEATKEAPAAISVVAVAKDGATVAAGDAQREVRLYPTAAASKEALKTGKWMNHTTRVTGLKWSPSGKWLASVSTDRRLCVWAPDQDQAVLSLDLAGPQPFTACAWADETSLWLLGSDGVATKKTITL
jgi:WD40 repeat protein